MKDPYAVSEKEYKDSLIRDLEKSAMRCIQNNLDAIWVDAISTNYRDYGYSDHLGDWRKEVIDEIFDDSLQNSLRMKLSLTPIKK